MSFYGLWKGWELTEVLGKDDFGAVYSAKIDGEDVNSVVKVVNIPTDAEIIDKMLADGKSLSDAEDILQPIVDSWIDEIISKDTMGSDNIVKIQDYKLARYPYAPIWIIYIRLEKLSTIKDYFAKNPANASAVAQLGADICNALEMCENANIVKSEVTPGKLYASADGIFKLGGFESSKGMVIPGYVEASTAPSPDYLAPEIIMGKEATSLSNIYSLGLIMYQQINGGKLPFVSNMNDADEIKAATVKRLDKGVSFDVPANCDEALAKIIAKATAFTPDDRFDSIKEMARAIRAYIEKDFNSLNLIFDGKAAEVFANDEKAEANTEEAKAAAAAAAAEAALAKKQEEAAAKAAEEERRRVEKLKKEQEAAAAKEMEEERRAAERRDAKDQKLAKAKAAEEARLAEQQAEAEKREAERKAEEERIAAEKKAEEERKEAERIEAEKKARAAAAAAAAAQAAKEKEAEEKRRLEEEKRAAKERAEKQKAEAAAALAAKQAAEAEELRRKKAEAEAKKKAEADKKKAEAEKQAAKEKEIREREAKKKAAAAAAAKAAKEKAKLDKLKAKQEAKDAKKKKAEEKQASKKSAAKKPDGNKPSGDDKKGKSSTVRYIITAFVIIVVIVVFLLILRSCINSSDVDSTTSAGTTTIAPTTIPTTTEPDSNSTTVPTTTPTTEPTTEESTTEPTTEPSTTTTTTTNPTTTTTTTKPTTTTTTQSNTRPNNSSSNRGKVINDVYTSFDGRFQLDVPGWKSYVSEGSIVPSGYTSGYDNMITIDRSAYINPQYEIVWTKEMLESSLNVTIEGSITDITLPGGYSCQKITNAVTSANIRQHIYIFQVPMSSGISGGRYILRFMQAEGKADMLSISEQIMSTIKIY